MSNEEAIANLVGLMTSFHLEIRALPDDLKCTKCKSVLKNACQIPCYCRFCRACIDDLISKGDQFCPGGSKECGATPLSTAVPDFTANKSVLKLTAKCPLTGCLRECPLADMGGHMRVCSRKNIDSPFRELGCAHGALPGEEMSGHFLQESRGHSENLIGTVANISRDMEMLKRELLMREEQGRHMENEMKSMKDEMKSMKDENKSIKDVNKSIKDENKSIKDEMKSIKDENKSIKDENKSIKDEMKSIKDENKSIKDEMNSAKDDNKSIKIENESIKREKEVLCDRVRQLAAKLEREIDERHQRDERNLAMTTMVTGAIKSNRDEMEPVRSDIGSIRDEFDCMKYQMESMQMAMGVGQLDDWLIEEDVARTDWSWSERTSGKFGLAGVFELASSNVVSMGELRIWLRIWAGPRDRLLQWPFRCEVTVTVANRDVREASSEQTVQFEIERPEDNQYRLVCPFTFYHDEFIGPGQNLRRGVLVSCWIMPVEGQ